MRSLFNNSFKQDLRFYSSRHNKYISNCNITNCLSNIFKIYCNTFMFCNKVFNSLVLDNKLIIFSPSIYIYKINALKSLFVEIDFNLSSTYCGVISTTAFGMLGASNDKSSSIFRIVCNLRAPILSVS